LKTIEIKHSLIASSSIRKFLDLYDIGQLISCDFLTRGLNDTYLVTTLTDKFIYRVYRSGWRNQGDILFELEAILHLYRAGILVSIPIKTKEEQYITEMLVPEGTRYGVLFTFSKGDRPQINEENCFLIGKALARIHQSSDSFKTKQVRRFDLDLKHLLDDPMMLITPVIHKFLGEDKVSFLNQIVLELKSDIQCQHFEYGFCHGDFHNFNMHVFNKQIEAFDFDCCSMGYRSYDIAVFWWNLKQNYPSSEEKCWGAFMNGYLSVRHINTEHLKKFVTLRRIWFLGILLKNDDVWGTQWINETNLQSFIKQLEQDQIV
jgi:Ser/Thr protein kinase RdoA (MazF antagonist)